mgnify:CR=1 FL=1
MDYAIPALARRFVDVRLGSERAGSCHCIHRGKRDAADAQGDLVWAARGSEKGDLLDVGAEPLGHLEGVASFRVQEQYGDAILDAADHVGGAEGTA